MTGRAAFAALLLVAVATGARADATFTYVHTLNPRLRSGAVVLDVRPLGECQKRTIAGARCMPAVDFLGPHGRLVSFRHILWLLGSVGLSGTEQVVVVGDHAEVRDFVAGLLYLAGQHSVQVLTRSLSGGAGLPASAFGAPSRVPGPMRNPVYQGRVRDQLIVLRGELARDLRGADPPVLLDGRSEKEYWGIDIRAPRGGHIPGARRLPAATLRAELAQGHAQVPPLHDPVAYANGPFSSVAYFTLLRAGTGLRARVYIDGWQAWAADGALAVDSATYPTPGVSPASHPAMHPSPSPPAGVSTLGWVAVGLLATLAALILVGVGFLWGRRRGPQRAARAVVAVAVAGALLGAVPRTGLAQSASARRLSVEFEIMLGNVHLLNDPHTGDLQRKGLRARLSSALSYLGITARRYLDERGVQDPHLLAQVGALRRAYAAGQMEAFRALLQSLVDRYPVDLRGILPLRVTPMRVRSGRRLYQHMCMACHAVSDPAQEYPAPDLFHWAHIMPRREFAARLMGGVVGNFYTSLENPLSDEQLASLFALFVTGKTTHSATAPAAQSASQP